MLNKDLVDYIEKNIFIKYERFYAHGMLHINNVIKNMLMLADYYNLDKNMAYVIAVYHDSGLSVDRENHELEAGRIIASDVELKKFFNEDEIKIMKEAVEDHRGSRKTRPRNFYGECVSDSDRDFDIDILAKRQIGMSIKNYPELVTFDEHFERCYEYICKRINSNGKFNLWTNNPTLVLERDKFQKEYLNKEYAKSVYRNAWNKIIKEEGIKKLKKYYQDY